jgi:nucleoside transporter
MTVVSSSAPPLSPKLNLQLSLMMFLQYGIWGAWLPILFPYMGYLGFKPGESVAIFFVGAVGAIIGPFIAGQVADRYFNTERFLAVSHILGGILVWFLSSVHSFGGFLVFSLLYGLIYAPTLALTNSLTFHHIPDRDRDFGKIRVWGTIGWIVVGIAVGQWLAASHTPRGPEAIAAAAAKLQLPAGTPAETVVATAQNAGRADAFRFSAILGILMGVFCLMLPKTPPARFSGGGATGEGGLRKNATLEALGEIKRQPLLTLFLLAVPISMIHQFYFVHTSGFLTELQVREEAAQSFAKAINKILGLGGGGLMTVGQMTEILVLALIPFFAKKVSRKTLLAVGIVAYGLRMALFAYTTSMLPILVGVALHGFCFGCFIFVSFMVVDEETSKDVRASAQNLFNLVVMGLGITVGSWFAIYVVGQWAMVNGKTNYTKLFSVPMWMSAACLVLLLLFYRGGKKAAPVA